MADPNRKLFEEFNKHEQSPRGWCRVTTRATISLRADTTSTLRPNIAQIHVICNADIYLMAARLPPTSVNVCACASEWARAYDVGFLRPNYIFLYYFYLVLSSLIAVCSADFAVQRFSHCTKKGNIQNKFYRMILLRLRREETCFGFIRQVTLT